MCDLCNASDVWDIELWVADRLNVDSTRLVVDRCGNVLWVVALDEFAIDVELLEVYTELLQRMSVRL